MTSKIYLTCFNTNTGSGIVNGSTRGGDVIGYALAEDEMCIAQHLSSNSDFSKHDLGLTSDWKHKNYKEHYPDGYELEWIDENNLDNHSGWLSALRLNQEIKVKNSDE